VSKKNKKNGSQVRRAPQHRLNAGRHREVSATVTEVVTNQANAGARLAAIGVLGSTTALAAPGMAAAATGGGGPGAPGSNPAATMPMGMSQGAPVPYLNAFAPTIHIVVIGDSYTSGEGTNSSTYTTTPMEVSPTGDVVPPLIYPQHNSSTSAVNQAIAALQAANPGVNIQVTNVAVSGASRVSASSPSYPGTYFTQPAQLDAIKNADIIYNGFAGGNDNSFSDWGKNALVAPDSFMPTVWNSIYLPKFTSPWNPEGTDLPAQTAFLNSLAQMAPGATVITPSYPMPFQGKVADSWSIASPFVSSLGPNAVNLSDQFAQWLNADAQAATGNANVANVANGNTFLDVNMLNALSGHTLNDPEPGMNGVVPFSWGQAQMGQASFHPNPLGQSLEASAIYPVLAAALNRIGGQQGFSVNTDPPPSIQVTPAYQQNADGVQAQLSLITQFQQVSSLAQLAKQAQDNQLTNPDGSPTLWGQLMMGLNGQQPSANWPATPDSQNGQNGQAGQAGQNGQAVQSGQGGQNGQAAPGGDQRQPMADPVGGFLPPEFGGAGQNPPPAAWTTAPQGGTQPGGPQQGGSGGPQDGGPQGAPQGGQQGAPQGTPQGGDQQNGAPQGQPAGSGDAGQPAGNGSAAAPGAAASDASAPGAAATGAAATGAAATGAAATGAAATDGNPAPATGDTSPATGAAGQGAGGASTAAGDTSTAANGGTAAAGSGSTAPAAAAAPAAPATSAPAAPASDGSAAPASPPSFTSTPDPTGANPGPTVTAGGSPVSVPPPPMAPAISIPAPGITPTAITPAIAPTAVVSNPAPLSTPSITTSFTTPGASTGTPAFSDPAPVVMASASGGGAGSG
jgi:hypothetical protein